MHEAVQEVQQALETEGYVAGADIATALHLARNLARPLLVEGPAGVGKTEIAKTLARLAGTDLIRLQCYEGLDASSAIYEWNYQKQLLHIRATEASADTGLEARERDIFGPEFLLERPLLRAVRSERPSVLLIDEIDRADEAFEAFLLELLSEWQLSIPELGTLRAQHPPHTILTSNRSRDLSDALRRRCLYLWIDFPPFDKELQIVRARTPGFAEVLSAQLVALVQLLRRLPLEKTPGLAESLDWAAALALLGRDALGEDVLRDTAVALLKHPEDQRRLSRWLPLLLAALGEGAPDAAALEEAWERVGPQLA